MADLWQPFLDRPRASALFTDFDGTLADIVDDPAVALPRAGVPELLGALADRLAVVGVLSGRTLSFLEPLLPDPRIVIAGLYGLEQRVDGERVDHPGGGVWREAVADVIATARHTGPPGMRAESKGLSLTLHYRERPEIGDDVAAWAAAQARRTGLSMRLARMSVELHPPIAADKGTTLEDLVAARASTAPITNVGFIGDDLGDLTAFDALDRLAAAGTHTVRVAVTSDEAAPELLARADLVVDGPPGAVAIIHELLGA